MNRSGLISGQQFSIYDEIDELSPNMLDDPQKTAKKINQYFLLINFESLVTMFWFSAISDIFKFSLGSLL